MRKAVFTIAAATLIVACGGGKKSSSGAPIAGCDDGGGACGYGAGIDATYCASDVGGTWLPAGCPAANQVGTCAVLATMPGTLDPVLPGLHRHERRDRMHLRRRHLDRGRWWRWRWYDDHRELPLVRLHVRPGHRRHDGRGHHVAAERVQRRRRIVRDGRVLDDRHRLGPLLLRERRRRHHGRDRARVLLHGGLESRGRAGVLRRAARGVWQY